MIPESQRFFSTPSLTSLYRFGLLNPLDLGPSESDSSRAQSADSSSSMLSANVVTAYTPSPRSSDSPDSSTADSAPDLAVLLQPPGASTATRATTSGEASTTSSTMTTESTSTPVTDSATSASSTAASTNAGSSTVSAFSLSSSGPSSPPFLGSGIRKENVYIGTGTSPPSSMMYTTYSSSLSDIAAAQEGEERPPKRARLGNSIPTHDSDDAMDTSVASMSPARLDQDNSRANNYSLRHLINRIPGSNREFILFPTEAEQIEESSSASLSTRVSMLDSIDCCNPTENQNHDREVGHKVCIIYPWMSE